MVVVWVRVPEIPVTVIVAGPTVAVLDAVSVRMLVPVVVDGLNDAVTPVGRPDAVRLTDPLKLLMSSMMMVLVALLPWTTLRVFCVVENE
jgi:hypothetical protein